MSTTRRVRGENRFYMAPPMRKLQQEEQEKKRLEAEEEKRKAKKLSEDLLITNSSNSVREYSDPITVDLLIDILSRVPAKSIGRFRCVSKFWKSILSRPDFTELFLTKSQSRPRLFFVVKVLNKELSSPPCDDLGTREELLVFSSPQPQNPNDNSSLVATRNKSFPKYFPTDIYNIRTPVCGLVFLKKWGRKGRVICNPTTGESITLPKVKATGIGNSYFGFDPISKQYKVLCMTWSRYGTPNTHRVLTLQTTGKPLWRTIQDPVFPHVTLSDGISINGVLYYWHYNTDYERTDKIVCFDFRFEKFSLVNMDDSMLILPYRGQLAFFNNKGKLGAYYYGSHWCPQEVVLWVLEDAGKHKWSKRVCVLPNTVNNDNFVGMTSTGEIVFSPHILSNPFYIWYYSIERNTLTRVTIKGFEEFKDHAVIQTFLDYVETVQGFIT